MISVLGVKRILIILVLIAINSALAAGSYMYLKPQNESKDRELRTLKGKVVAKREDVRQLRDDLARIEEQKDYFANLQRAGFFSDQNRVVARKRIEDIQKFTNILNAEYSIKSAREENTELASEADQVILNSSSRIDISALDDFDFYNFIYWVENAFPGHVLVKKVSIERKLDVNDATIRRIGSGQAVEMIEGELEFDWRTLIPDKQTGTTVGGIR